MDADPISEMGEMENDSWPDDLDQRPNERHECRGALPDRTSWSFSIGVASVDSPTETTSTAIPPAKWAVALRRLTMTVNTLAENLPSAAARNEMQIHQGK
jgi:hypothetical protein